MKLRNVTRGMFVLFALSVVPFAAQAADENKPTNVEHTVDDDQFLNGFRLGYMFVMNTETPFDDRSDETYAAHYGIQTPHQFVIGYEATWRMIGHDWLNVLLVGNVMVAGLEQSKIMPSFNALLGFEMDESFQIGVGTSLSPTRENPAHMLIAAGWTPRVGSFYVPVHLFFVPDVYGRNRMGVTTGVNW